MFGLGLLIGAPDRGSAPFCILGDGDLPAREVKLFFGLARTALQRWPACSFPGPKCQRLPDGYRCREA